MYHGFPHDILLLFQDARLPEPAFPPESPIDTPKSLGIFDSTYAVNTFHFPCPSIELANRVTLRRVETRSVLLSTHAQATTLLSPDDVMTLVVRYFS